jgi:hypothetical protein
LNIIRTTSHQFKVRQVVLLLKNPILKRQTVPCFDKSDINGLKRHICRFSPMISVTYQSRELFAFLKLVFLREVPPA